MLIPTYIVRSKSKQHIRDLLDDKADADMNDPDVVARNLKGAKPPLPEQNVYVIDKRTLTQVVSVREPRDGINEWLLLQDLGEARRRRVRG